MLSGKFFRNTGWNLIGQIAPLVVAVVTLPHLIKLMGMERYGFLTLVWVLVGYAGIFDFGIGRAVTRTVANRLAMADRRGAEEVSKVGLSYMLGFGGLVGLIFAALSSWLATAAFQIPVTLRQEATHSLMLLSISIPFVMLSAGYSAILAAYQQFGTLNLVRALMGVATYIGPLVVVGWNARLEYVVGFVVVMRIASSFAYALICEKQCGVKFVFSRPDGEISKELFSLGGWITVSNVVSPFLTYLDRLLLGGLVTMQAVAYYATPYDVVSKAMIVPYAIIGAIFPVAAGLAGSGNRSSELFSQSLRSVLVAVFPLSLIVFVLGPPFLGLWLGREFAENSVRVTQWLAVGLLLNALAQVPAMMIQAAGRPKWMAILHLVELPVFLFVLWILTIKMGIAGTAVAAAARFALDAAVLFALSIRGRLVEVRNWSRALESSVVCGLLLTGACLIPDGLAASAGYFVAALAVFCLYVWRRVLLSTERLRIMSRLRWSPVAG